MDYSNFLMMKEELSLIAVMVILLLYDLMASKNGLRYFQPVACILFGVHTLPAEIMKYMPSSVVSVRK